jgi:hypothetical protein
MNSSIHESIGIPPAQLQFGNAVDLDHGIFLQVPQTTLNANVSLSNISSDMLNMPNKLLRSSATSILPTTINSTFNGNLLM